MSGLRSRERLLLDARQIAHLCRIQLARGGEQLVQTGLQLLRQLLGVLVELLERSGLLEFRGRSIELLDDGVSLSTPTSFGKLT